jgi:hypothetical protein
MSQASVWFYTDEGNVVILRLEEGQSQMRMAGGWWMVKIGGRDAGLDGIRSRENGDGSEAKEDGKNNEQVLENEMGGEQIERSH